MSTVAWLDTPADEQRRVRDLIALLGETESRDELGSGQFRDVLSDALFPGTPRCCRRGPGTSCWCRGPTSTPRVAVAVAISTPVLGRSSVSFVEVLRKGDEEGVIRRVVGYHVKNLPSMMFWSGVRRYGSR